MTLKECYDKLEGDYEGACKRLINEKLLLRFLQKFPEDPSMQLLRDAVNKDDIENSFRSVHTLKGVSGNLGLTALYNAAVNLTEQLRPRQETADMNLFQALTCEYDRTISVLHEMYGDQAQ
ncbi:MAG: Hpt domain-containing protein [Bacteroidaceae bacterium]|nr:Hpt domain-containing protein [Bacteroidaceae bacterium]